MRRRPIGNLFLAVGLMLSTSACSSSVAEPYDPFDSVAQLRGYVCGRSMVGGAVLIGPGLLVTAAHNVAGSEGGVTATFEDGVQRPVNLVGIDTQRDLALLSVATLESIAGRRLFANGWGNLSSLQRIEPMGMSNPTPGENGRMIRLRAQAERAEVPYTDAEMVVAVGRDMYDRESSVRRINVRVRAAAGAGYSGGPVLNRNDAMIGLVYATARLEDMTYANATSEVRLFLRSVDPGTEASSGPCP